MDVAITHASAEIGIDAPPITVEVRVSSGLPNTRIVGLPETAVRESKDRVSAAITSSGYHYPSRRVTVNLAPADMPKQGGRYDLAIAIAILAASGQIAINAVAGYEFLGELSLTGALRRVTGVLPAALRSRNGQCRLVIPTGNEAEAAISGRRDIAHAADLAAVVAHLTGQARLPCVDSSLASIPQRPRALLSDVEGQLAAKRALVIAAVGTHNLLMIGPPGTGKTMLATRLPGLLPPLTRDEALEVASIASVSGQAFDYSQWGERPFRAPHHTASATAIVGGRSPPRPGEISLAHLGVLFLDELPEFPRHVLEVLREPVESGEVWISRAAAQVRYPARFQLVAAMNPCPCGYSGDPRQTCECTADRIQRYRSKVSGPLLDRIDLHVEVPPLPAGVLSSQSGHNSSPDQHYQQRVTETRQLMIDRQGKPNGLLDSKEAMRVCSLSRDDQRYLDDAGTRLGISARGYFKLLKVARTIADLSGKDEVDRSHLVEALGYRRLDRRQ